MSSPPNPPGRFEKKYTHFPSAEYAGSKSLAAESNDTAAGALQLSPLRRDIQISHPPGPPFRSVDPHSSVVPSGLAASRISECSLDTPPGPTSSAADVIASVVGRPGATDPGPAPVDAAPPHAAQKIHGHIRIAATLPHATAAIRVAAASTPSEDDRVKPGGVAAVKRVGLVAWLALVVIVAIWTERRIDHRADAPAPAPPPPPPPPPRA